MLSAVRAFGYFVEEALVSLWRSRLIHVLSISSIAVSLFVLGAFLTVATNLNDVVERWAERVQVTFFLKDDIEPRIRQSLQNRLDDDGAVAEIVSVSRDDALQRFRELFRDLASLPDEMGENPFPASFEITVAPTHRTAEAVEQLVARHADAPGVEDVQYDLLWIQRLSTLVGLVRGIGVFLGGILVLAGVFTISNVIRLTVYARQDELDIMRLVGATRSYVRGPFVMEGMILGGLGGFVSVGLLWLTFGVFASDVLSASDLTGMTAVRVPGALLTAVVGGGTLVGLVGSLVSLGRSRL